MTIAYWCVLVVIFFPYFFTILAKTGAHFNNHDPRAYLEGATGWRKRAYYVQLNSFEALPAFGFAVVIAHLMQVDQFKLDILAITFVIARILYAICYLADKAFLRSLVWALGIACIISMFCIN